MATLATLASQKETALPTRNRYHSSFSGFALRHPHRRLHIRSTYGYQFATPFRGWVLGCHLSPPAKTRANGWRFGCPMWNPRCWRDGTWGGYGKKEGVVTIATIATIATQKDTPLVNGTCYHSPPYGRAKPPSAPAVMTRMESAPSFALPFSSAGK